MDMKRSLQRTLPLFEVPTVVDAVTVAFDVPVTPDRIVIVEAGELEPSWDDVTGRVTPELVTARTVAVVEAVAEMPGRMSLSAFCYYFVLNTRSKRRGADRGLSLCGVDEEGGCEGVLNSHTSLNTTHDSGRRHRGAGGVIRTNDSIGRDQRRQCTANRCDSGIFGIRVSCDLVSCFGDGFTYAGGMSA